MGEKILRDLGENDRQELESLTVDLKDTKLECAPHSTWVAIAQMCLGKARLVNSGAYDMDDEYDARSSGWASQLCRIGETILRHSHLKTGGCNGESSERED